MLLKEVAAATETCEKSEPHFTRNDMASTLTICFLHQCTIRV